MEEPPESPVPSVIVTESEHSLRNIWADHRARRAMFPTRQRTMQPEDDEEDIYQMFVPTEPSGPEPELPTGRSEAASSPKTARPCSWHVEQVPIVLVESPGTGGRALRRASSAGEKATEGRQSPDQDNVDPIHTESSSNDVSGSSSVEQLTMDDVENVYDNISYEDLKRMGLLRREPEGGPRGGLTHAPGSPSAPVVLGETEPESSSESNRSSMQEGPPFGPSDLKMDEENVYDTICFRDPPPMGINEGKKQGGASLLVLEQDLRGFVSQESLHFREDEEADGSRPVPDYSSSSSASETFSQPPPKGDKMSEQVDQIWNDLENYIKSNEKKADRLPAAFPVSESPKKTSSPPTHRPNPPPVTSTPSFTVPLLNLPELQGEAATGAEHLSPASSSQPPPVTPEPLPGTVKTIRRRLARLSSGSSRQEDGDPGELPQRNRGGLAVQDLHSLFPETLAGLDSPPLASSSSSSLLLGHPVDLPPELVDKSRNRVFLMARQYSQKIKRANQLLRMRSMDPGDSCSRARAEKKQKDLAAIMEEKKQGGAAIGARIAEYSQLYEQVVFKDAAAPAGPTSTHPGLPSSPSMPETYLEDDWLHSTYSNGELASFMKDPQPSPPHCRLTSSCSIPSFQTFPPSPPAPPSQRWSITAPSEKEEQVYSSVKRNSSFNQPSSSWSSCSRSGSSPGLKDQSGLGCNGSTDGLHGPGLGQVGRQSSLPENFNQGQPDLTLQDGQQVVVLNRASALSILNATQSYLANFKDNGEDDDDYVEIRSEDELDQQQDRLAELTGPNGGLVHAQSLPCTPVRSCDPLGSLNRDHLERYLWSEPQQNQPKLVQSLRDKFQCLSSGSFA